MKNKLFSFLILFLSSLLAKANVTNNGHHLTVIIPNTKNTSGKIQIGLFNNAKDFPKNNRQYKTVTIHAAKGATYTFKNLPAGEYGVAVMHDENSNGKCDMNALGIPKEGYGFSNNVKPKLSAPSFAVVKFQLNAHKKIFINLIY